jgi:hypothetical protein
MDKITALISCSPIKSHPSTEIIEECIESIKERTDARIIVMADGVREEQEDYRPRYEEFLTRLRKKYPDIGISSMAEHKHQARTTRDTLSEVTTPVILFIEHDMALYGDIPIEEMYNMITSGEADLIRLLYEDNDLINYTHLMIEKVGDYTKTKQWSQRPSLASTQYYRRILNDHFSPKSKTFIEDRMHGVIEAEDNWNHNKLWTYTPEIPVQRFTYKDGREGDSKFDDLLIY